MKYKVLINGAGGNMGRVLQELIMDEPEIEIIGLSDIFPPFSSLTEQTQRADCVIDFSSPKSLDDLLSYALRYRVPIVIGTTGFTSEQMVEIEQASKEIPIMISPNFSKGVCSFIKAVRIIEKALKDSHVEITEIHRKDKIDAPSGTALRIKKVIEEEGGNVEIKSIRTGECLGEHIICFKTPYQQISLTHKALSRKCFAEGVLSAFHFIVDKRCGLFTSLDDIEEMGKDLNN